MIRGLLIACLAVPPAARAQAIPVDVLLRSPRFTQFSPPVFSPDGKWIAYVVQDNARMRSDLWGSGSDIAIMRVDGGVARIITGAIGSNWAPKWSPDGESLGFFADRDGSDSVRVWVWDRRTSRVRRVAPIAVRAYSSLQWMRDGRSLLVTLAPRAVASGRADSALRSPIRVYYSGGHDAATSDPWSLDSDLGDVVTVGIEKGDVRPLIRHQRIGAAVLSPDGRRVLYTRAVRFERAGSQQILWDLRTIDLASGRDTLLVAGVRLNIDGAQVSWSPAGDAIAYQSNGRDERGNDCYVVRLDGKPTRRLEPTEVDTSSGRQNISPPLWVGNDRVFFLHRGRLWRGDVARGTSTPVGSIPDRTITALVTRGPGELWTDSAGAALVLTHDDVGKRDGFYALDLATGRSTKLRETGECFRCANLLQNVISSPDGQHIVYVAEDASHPSDLWVTDPAFRAPRRLTHLNPDLDAYPMGSARFIEWHSLDGEPLRGILLVPPSYHEGMRVPLVVWVYGGVRLSDVFDGFGLAGRGLFNMQLLASRGYAVLLPDAPQREGTPMVDLAKTVLPGVDKAIELGIADSSRLGIMGHSYGGYTTLSLIVQTNRFKAAMAADGYADLMSHYGQMDTSGAAFGTSIMESSQGLMGGTPWQFRDRYIENSPVMYLDRVTTPLLLIHGDEDETVSPFLSDEVFVDLRRLGKEVTYVKYRGESHDPNYWRLANQVDFATRMIAWFDAHLR